MDKLNAALNQGLDAGLTINEAGNSHQLYAYTGFPRSLNALNELRVKVVETRKQRGIEDIEGKRHDRPIPVGMSFSVSVPQTRRKSQARLCRGHCLILRQRQINSANTSVRRYLQNQR